MHKLVGFASFYIFQNHILFLRFSESDFSKVFLSLSQVSS